MDSKFMTVPYEKPADNCVAFMRIAVSDMARSQAFFETVFGWNFKPEPYKPTIVVFKTPGSQVMGTLHLRDDAGVKTPSVLNYIKVADVDETLKKVSEAGGKIIKEKFNEGGHTDLGEFEDTEGNRWGVLRWLTA